MHGRFALTCGRLRAGLALVGHGNALELHLKRSVRVKGDGDGEEVTKLTFLLPELCHFNF